MTKTKTKINRFLGWVLLTLFRTIILISGYFFEAMMYLCEFLLFLIHRVGKPLGIRVRFFDEGEEAEEKEQPTFEPKFTGEDIDAMVKQVHPQSTIKEIEGQLGVSYRQARKIKEAAKSPIAIQHYRWTA